MTNNFKIGDKLLLPVTFDGFTLMADPDAAWVVLDQNHIIAIEPGDVANLIPASTLTYLQAENDRLKTALSDIASMLEQFARPSVRYVALKALGRDV